MPQAVILMPAQFTVTVGTLTVECQVSEATVAFDTTTATIKTLCAENEVTTAEKGKLTLAGYQDFTVADGLCKFLWDNALAQAAFIITGTDTEGNIATLTGAMQCRRPPFGPTADDAAKFSIDMPIIGIPDLVVTPGAGALAAAE
jgi:hypothetical protein